VKKHSFLRFLVRNACFYGLDISSKPTLNVPNTNLRPIQTKIYLIAKNSLGNLKIVYFKATPLCPNVEFPQCPILISGNIHWKRPLRFNMFACLHESMSCVYVFFSTSLSNCVLRAMYLVFCSCSIHLFQSQHIYLSECRCTHYIVFMTLLVP